jgi:hypothetical protein
MRFLTLEDMIGWYVHCCFSSGDEEGSFHDMCELAYQKAIGLPIPDVTFTVDHFEEINARVDFENIVGLNENHNRRTSSNFTDNERAAILVYGLMRINYDDDPDDIHHLSDRFDNGIGYAANVLKQGWSVEDVMRRYFQDNDFCIANRREPPPYHAGYDLIRINRVLDRLENLLFEAEYLIERKQRRTENKKISAAA